MKLVIVDIKNPEKDPKQVGNPHELGGRIRPSDSGRTPGSPSESKQDLVQEDQRERAKEGHSIRYSRDCEQGDGAGAGPQDPFKVSCCCRLFIGISLKDKRCHQRVDRAWVWR